MEQNAALWTRKRSGSKSSPDWARTRRALTKEKSKRAEAKTREGPDLVRTLFGPGPDLGNIGAQEEEKQSRTRARLDPIRTRSCHEPHPFDRRKLKKKKEKEEGKRYKRGPKGFEKGRGVLKEIGFGRRWLGSFEVTWSRGRREGIERREDREKRKNAKISGKI
ncbi:hypothetical protein Ancab_039900 [Ancistrocladus abbreviatus]